MNNALYDALGDIELNTEWATLNKLASYGIDIDSSLYDSNDIFANIAANHELDIEISDIDLLVWALSDLGCDMVYIRGSSFLNPVKKKLVEELTRRKIKYTETTRDPNTYNFPVYIELRKGVRNSYTPYKLCKVIHTVNSTPIEIK